MPWVSSASTNRDLVRNLTKQGLIRSSRLKKSDWLWCYNLSTSPAAETLIDFLRPGAKVLDVGSGSGYFCAVLHHLVGRRGKVVGIEHIPELTEWSRENLSRDGLDLAWGKGSIEMITGDGKQGWPRRAPYDAINVGAAAPQIPQALIDQLAKPGRMLIPLGTDTQKLYQVDKDKEGNITEKALYDVLCLPLTDRKGFKREAFPQDTSTFLGTE
ncbi:hypothetical protein QCA50_015506 [Cerrena zonata]|uniref:protein-L-isoaspartate(D-aspartate) O-methyltransferase n=1 Tax=Cerrena zonata TaxID=2478898 RepID=A0AAW0FT46_9APHY